MDCTKVKILTCNICEATLRSSSDSKGVIICLENICISKKGKAVKIEYSRGAPNIERYLILP